MSIVDLRDYYEQSYPPSLWSGDDDGGGGGGGGVVVEVPVASMSATVTVAGGTPDAHYRYDWGDGQNGDIVLDGTGGGQIQHVYQTPGTYHGVARNEANVIVAETDIVVPGPDEPAQLLDVEPFDPAAHTIADVQAYVTDHPDEAAAVLDAEVARGDQARTTLVAWLEDLTG